MELIRHSSYNSSTLPKILPFALQIFPCPFTFFLPLFFFFSTSLINKKIKELKTSKKNNDLIKKFKMGLKILNFKLTF